MRILEQGRGAPLKLSDEQRFRLEGWLREENLRANAARNGIDNVILDALQRYQGMYGRAAGTSANSVGNTDAIENPTPIELTIGAIAVEGIYAKAMELFYQLGNPATVRPRKGYEQYAEAVQDFIDWGIRAQWEFEEASDEGILECVKLGTVLLYVPWVETVKVTDVSKTIERGPKIIAMPIEDYLFPEGARSNVQRMKWVTMVMWKTSEDLRLDAQRAEQAGAPWYRAAFEMIQPAANVSRIRQQRLDLEGDEGSPTDRGKLYQFGYTTAQFDVDEDGIEEDLDIIHDITSGKVLHVSYMRWDTRPFEHTVYQNRGHVPMGIGVMEMAGPGENELTTIHNERVINMRIANNRAWKARQTAANSLTKIWPGKVVTVNDMDDFEGVQLGDIYPSTFQSEAMILAFVERRTGVSDLNAGARLGGRTPGVTALSVLQSANARFVPAFMNMRRCYARAIVQCLYRYQEQVKKGNEQVIRDIQDVLEPAKAAALLELFQKNNVDLVDAVDIQITASNPSVSRESDRQNLVMLAGLWEKYAQGQMQLQQIVSAPAVSGQNGEMPPSDEMKKLAKDLSAASTKLMRKIVRTFDQVSDVDQYLVEVHEAEQAMSNPMQAGLQGLTQLMAQFGQNGEQQPPPQGPMQ